MWARDKSFQPAGFSTPPPTWKSGTANPPPMVPKSERKTISPAARCDLFHITHKVPAGDSPYIRAKQVQLIDKNPSKAISLFLAAINAGDRVDSALKDMVVVMKQLDRAEEAIEAIRSFRHLCPFESQESLDNVLVELDKRAGGIDDEIEMLQSKRKRMDEGIAFKGKRTKGTTTIAMIGGDVIFLATDRRLTDGEHHHIVGNGCKIFIVKARGQPILATIAGRIHDCRAMLRYVKKKVRRGISQGIFRSSKSIHTAAFYAMKYISTWELKHTNKTFPARSLLAGWDGEQPCVYKIASANRGGLEYAGDRNSIVVTGSGGSYAHYYAKRNIRLCNSNQFGRVARDSVLNSSMQDAPTGDQIQSAEVLQNGYNKGSPRDVLHILEMQYVAFQTMLENALFFVHSKADLPYTHALDKIVSDEIVARLGVSLAQVPHVIALKARYVVRIVILNQSSHTAFEVLRAGADLHLVTPFSDWPWLYFDRLPLIPMFFARATRDMITVLGKL